MSLSSVACSRLEHSALTSELFNYALNTEFEAAIGKLGQSIHNLCKIILPMKKKILKR